jgi:putative transcriptional regulator
MIGTQLRKMDFTPSKVASPKGTEVRELRETFGISQTEAAEMVYSTLRSWQNWEADEVSMHPAIWAWFKHSVQNAGSAKPLDVPEDPSRDVKYVQRVISFWWNSRDKSIHVTTQGTEQPLHTTFPRTSEAIAGTSQCSTGSD